jgi:protein-S-isoprenylcysteine O-methyltransferase Ste14
VVLQGVSDVLLLAGTAWAVWSLRSLGRNLSVIAQVRDVADGGPYRWIRLPLYAGEILSTLGLAIAAHRLAAAAVWLGICGLQAYRAVREEQLLLAVLPGYGAYRIRTAALLPGIF